MLKVQGTDIGLRVDDFTEQRNKMGAKMQSQSEYEKRRWSLVGSSCGSCESRRSDLGGGGKGGDRVVVWSTVWGKLKEGEV